MQAENSIEKEAISITSDGPALIRARNRYGDLELNEAGQLKQSNAVEAKGLPKSHQGLFEKNHEFREGWALSPQN